METQRIVRTRRASKVVLFYVYRRSFFRQGGVGEGEWEIRVRCTVDLTRFRRTFDFVAAYPRT